MPHPYRKIIPGNSPGDVDHFGGNDYNLLTLWHEDVDLTAGIYVDTPYPSRVATPTEFRDQRLRLLNPARDNVIKIRTLDFDEDYNLTIPLMTEDDEFMLLALDQVIYNKTLSLEDNILTSNAISLGDLIGSNGTKYVRVPIGLPGQVLTVSENGLTWQWADPVITEGTGGSGGIPDDNSVSTAKIQNGAVTDAKLAGSISGVRLLDSAITTNKIADSAVTAGKISNNTITGNKLVNNTITNIQIASSTIQGVNMANSAIGTTQLADNAVTTSKILDNNVTSAKIASNIAWTKLNDVVPLQKSGMNYGAHAKTTAAGGIGVLNGFITTVGSHSYGFNDTYGPHSIFTTGAVSGNGAGWRSNSTLARSVRNPIIYGAFSLTQTTLFELFIGFHALNAFPTSGDPLNVIHGFGLTATGSGNFRLAVNDGVGNTQFQNLTPTKAVDTNTHTFVLSATAAGTSVTLDLDGGTNVATLNSNIPTPSQGMGAGAYIETTTTATKAFSLFRWEGFF